MAHTIEDCYGLLTTIAGQVATIAANQPPVPKPTGAAISIADAQKLKAENPYLKFTLDGTNFTFTETTMLGVQHWITPWNGQ